MTGRLARADKLQAIEVRGGKESRTVEKVVGLGGEDIDKIRFPGHPGAFDDEDLAAADWRESGEIANAADVEAASIELAPVHF
jgi:hypothetical protein